MQNTAKAVLRDVLTVEELEEFTLSRHTQISRVSPFPIVTKPLNELNVRELYHLGLFLLRFEYKDGLIPRVNLISYTWETLLFRAISKDLHVF